jgi:hypothetical protein
VKRNIFPKSKVYQPDESPNMKHNHDNAWNTGLQLKPACFAFVRLTANNVCGEETFNERRLNPLAGKPGPTRLARENRF